MAPGLTYARRFPNVDAEISFGLGQVQIAIGAAIIIVRHPRRVGSRAVVLGVNGPAEAVKDTIAVPVSQLEEEPKRTQANEHRRLSNK